MKLGTKAWSLLNSTGVSRFFSCSSYMAKAVGQEIPFPCNKCTHIMRFTGKSQKIIGRIKMQFIVFSVLLTWVMNLPVGFRTLRALLRMSLMKSQISPCGVVESGISVRSPKTKSNFVPSPMYWSSHLMQSATMILNKKHWINYTLSITFVQNYCCLMKF